METNTEKMMSITSSTCHITFLYYNFLDCPVYFKMQCFRAIVYHVVMKNENISGILEFLTHILNFFRTFKFCILFAV